jgi:hypothetical protein
MIAQPFIDKNPPKYVPSPEEIAAKCREIRSSWSDAKERSRYPQEPRYTFQELRVVDICVG